MKRVSLASVLLLGTAGFALADECVVNPSTPVHNGTDTEISIIFDDFFGYPGNNGTCSLVIPAHDNLPNDPDVFQVYSAIYGGFIDDGVTATIEVEQKGFSDGAEVDGLVLSEYFSTFAGKDEDGNIVSKTTVKISEGTPTQVESLDYAEIANMTRDDAEDSVDQIGLAQVGLVTHLDATANLLTSGNLSLEGANEVGVIGGIGSYTLGTNARLNIVDGFSLLAGVSIIDLGAGGTEATGTLGAAAIRYVQPDATGFRLFGEGGLQGAALGLSFTRTYEDSNGDHTATGHGEGLLGAAYVRGGVLIEPDENNEIVVSASVKQSVLGISTYSEQVSADNPFAADLSGNEASFTTVKAGVDWTTQLTSDIDLTASGAIGSTSGNTGTAAYIFGGGDVMGTPQSAFFTEYGVRVGWMPTPDARLDGFIAGSTGVGIGTHAQIGAAYHMSF